LRIPPLEKVEPNPPLEKVEPNFNNGFAPLFLKVDKILIMVLLHFF
jgi:hypothetical protein